MRISWSWGRNPSKRGLKRSFKTPSEEWWRLVSGSSHRINRQPIRARNFNKWLAFGGDGTITATTATNSGG